MLLKNTYVVGTLIQFFEVGMVDEHIHSCIKMLDGIENKENVTFHFTISFQEYLEQVDWQKLEDTFKYEFDGWTEEMRNRTLERIFNKKLYEIEKHTGIVPIVDFKHKSSDFYNIAHQRRDLCYNWQDKVDVVIWGECDSLFPSQTLEIIDSLHNQAKVTTPKYVANFAGRKNWDKSWDVVTHPMFKGSKFEDNEEWALNNEASEKSYMTQERMEEINNVSFEDINVVSFTEPKADGSCLVISAELLKSNVNIPSSVWLAGEDTAFMDMAKLIMGDNFVQFHVSNILRVHNRRHPKKRQFVLGEDNPRGFCDDRKGKEPFWKKVEAASKQNASNFRNQVRNNTIEEILQTIC